jgi:hypothetical protein
VQWIPPLAEVYGQFGSGIGGFALLCELEFAAMTNSSHRTNNFGSRKYLEFKEVTGREYSSMQPDCLSWIGIRKYSRRKSEWARQTWEYVAPIHICGHCPHPSNHLRRRIHQPSLLAPQYTSQDLCPQDTFAQETPSFLNFLLFHRRSSIRSLKRAHTTLQDDVIVSTSRRKNSTGHH